jgi:hypothetical protein
MNNTDEHHQERGAHSDEVLDVQVVLTGGFSFQLRLGARDELFQCLINSVAASVGDRAEKVLNVEIDDGQGSIIFRPESILAIRTRPAVELEAQFRPSTNPAVTGHTPVICQSFHKTSWYHLEGFMEHDVVRTFAALCEESLPAFQRVYDSHENLSIASMAERAPLWPIQVEIRGAIREIIERALCDLNIGIFAYELTVELCALFDGDYSGPRQTASCATGHRRVFEFIYFLTDDISMTGGALRLFDSIGLGEAAAPRSIAAEFPSSSNSIVIFPSETFHELTAVCSKSSRPLYLVRGCGRIATP